MLGGKIDTKKMCVSFLPNKCCSLTLSACLGWCACVCLFVYVLRGVCWKSQGLAYSGLLEFRPAQEQMYLEEWWW